MVQTWQIGELARRTGLTVRALRHYDRIGLLAPARRTPAGYRIYDGGDVARLQRILSLRALGFSLSQIGAILEADRWSLSQTVALHMERVREQISQHRRLLRRLEALSETLQTRRNVDVEQIFKTIEVMQMVEQHGFDPKFTPEQMEQIKKQGDALGQEAIQQVEQAWPELIARAQAELDRGTPPDDPRVRALARRWKELVNLFSGGDRQIEAQLGQAYREAPDFGAQFGLTPELMAYVQQAWAHEEG